MAESQSEKLHAACDECRARKLKCSGKSPCCSRCEEENISCVYSPQKPMGRPRKRRREEESGLPAGPRIQQLESNHKSSAGIFEATSFDEFALVSPPDFTNFPGFEDLQGTNGIPEPLLLADRQPSSLSNGHNHSHAHHHHDFAMDSAIDPSLTNPRSTDPTFDHQLGLPPNQPAPEAPCTCLSLMYLTMTELQTMSTFAFPAVIHTQRHAMSAASSLIHCPKCPTATLSVIQNVQSLGALLSTIAERFHKILSEIDVQAEELERTGQKKEFRLGDSDPTNQYLHTGMPDCPMGFDIQLDGKDWKALTKKALKSEVLGGGSSRISLAALLDEFEQRQLRWHESGNNREERIKIFGAENTCGVMEGPSPCQHMINQVRAMIRSMQWE